MTHLTFGYEFNQKVELPKNLLNLTFGFCFNQKVDLLENLTHLNFGFEFNQKVNLPCNLTHLTFGRNFNQRVELPFGVKYLKLFNDEDYNDNTLCNLPNSLKVIKLHKKYNGNLKRLLVNTKIEYYE